MLPDDSSRSTEGSAEVNFGKTGQAQVLSWPPPESEVADTEASLTHVHAMIAQVEQTINRAKTYLATLAADAPLLRQSLTRAGAERDASRLADLRAARGLRAELVKASLESVTVSQSAARYLQARERFLVARRDWAKRSVKR